MTDEMQISEGEQQSTPQFYYTIAGCNILLEPGMKTEIIEKQVIFPIPHSPPWCQGMISLRGKLIPVANLHKLLNSSDQRGALDYIVKPYVDTELLQRLSEI